MPKTKTPQSPPPITFPEIVSAVNSILPRSPRSLRSDMVRLQIKPVGSFRSCPRRYPWNAPQVIIAALGYETALMQLPPLDTAAARLRLHTVTIDGKAERIASARIIKGKGKR
jgi:hypothetical protein